MVFREGENIEVEVIGEIPEEFSGGWIIRFPDESRSILEKKHYRSYSLKIGQRLRGRIDKINCAGKVFFEPEHPCYLIGQEYLFSVESIKMLNSNSFQITIKDCFETLVDVPSVKFHDVGSLVRLKVRNIRKGKLFLEFPDEPHLNSIQYRNLTVLRIEKVDGIDCYILEDHDKKEFYLPIKWYQHHGLSVGFKVECRIWFSESQNTFRVEPKHPCYSENQRIEINILQRPSGYYGRDCFGKLIKIHGFDPEKTYPQTVTCRILRIRKGKPVLIYEPNPG